MFFFVRLNTFQDHEAEKGRASPMVLNRIGRDFFRLARIQAGGHNHRCDIPDSGNVSFMSWWQ